MRKRLLFGFLITAILSINGLLIGDEGSEPTLEELTSRYIELRDAAHKGDETAIEFLIKLGESMPMAWSDLGYMYTEGIGVQQDYKEAFKWYSKAEKKGDLRATHNLGVIYYEGYGLPQDFKEAAKWFKRAAEKGKPESQARLGTLYFLGQGVKFDTIRGHMWLNIAIANGLEELRDLREELAEKMSQKEIERAQKLAREWLKEHPPN